LKWLATFPESGENVLVLLRGFEVLLNVAGLEWIEVFGESFKSAICPSDPLLLTGETEGPRGRGPRGQGPQPGLCLTLGDEAIADRSTRK